MFERMVSEKPGLSAAVLSRAAVVSSSVAPSSLSCNYDAIKRHLWLSMGSRAVC